MLKRDLKLRDFSLLISFLNFLLFHFPFFRFVVNNVDYKTFNGVSIIISLIILMLVANFFTFYLILFLSRIGGKVLLVLFFIINSIAIYFINTYSVIIDESMIGNILNTNYEESSSFFSFKLILYLLLLGILPGIYIIKAKIIKEKPKKFFITSSLTLLFMIILAFANASNWLWIDKNSKTLGGLAMPWSYSVNISLFYIHQSKKNEKEILLPKATIKDNQKSVMILVIGESARSQNFSLYGYGKNTNPLLSKIPNLHSYKATSCATYTTAGVKCILEHKNTDDLYEILPNYLYRNNVDVIWKTTNWGEPPVHIKNYQNKETLESRCKGENCQYDEVLLNGLKEEILTSKKDKILIVLHTSTSHGPTYSKKYPPKFEVFKPVCNSVELGKCSKEELINAYDNTIVYTDYILSSIIEDLKELKGYNSAMLYVSDHGESLGEKNLYMHGVPISIAPKEQYEIPFIVWTSDGSKQLKPNNTLSQNHVFHSVLNFLGVQSPAYDEKMNIFK
ncbi:TPA: phosphoethanolamine--lipid A transferase EptA [Elizabethkingia meningoseptica]|uniref:phosphoethanolamine--lipid A transferase EptA n=1 Tax=Elizabethkingia meningoseptica TaxID=238 RepID=UPI0022F17F2F|nr:phosphoethanolamine--lipid A transferase EptA [Elizabethkingia meningoseptica]EJK5327343.1 phosphoethanolamine--lipid A transferase EptA [Elizabethkingia meningoseptica]WBS74572.1 phosphoethanolamine--lipid A transferase EptA [Elizabethkingia meningoseptica]HAY3563596.1 phosphoethanolamine--lipid A transferase EptA [Elizabethkingia meningoseptica]